MIEVRQRKKTAATTKNPESVMPSSIFCQKRQILNINKRSGTAAVLIYDIY